MKKVSWLMVVFVIVGLILAACRQAAQPSPTAELKTPIVVPPTPKPAWEEKWSSVLSEAKKEGSVSVYSVWSPETRNALAEAFGQKYGIKLESSPFSRGADLVAKAQAETRAGIYAADVFGVGNPTILVMMKPAGLLSSVKPLLILPEVLEPKAWHAGMVPFTDKDGMALPMIAAIQRMVVYNTNLVKEGEITSYKDLLKPQYKGGIYLNDPSITGPGSSTIAYLCQYLWNDAETMDFLRRLVKEQEVAIQREHRLHIEAVVHGKYAIGLFPFPPALAEFLALRAPVKAAMAKEEDRVDAMSGVLAVPTKFAHPNATIVFINWLLTKEGQSTFAKGMRNPSTRVDASTEGIDPIFIPVAGKKYYLETEEHLADRGRLLELTQKVMQEAMK